MKEEGSFLKTHGTPWLLRSLPTEESSGRSIYPESLVQKLKRSFRTPVSPSYMDYIVSDAVPKLGLEFKVEKDIFQVKLSDNTHPDATISCKCTWSKNSQQLQLLKMEWSAVRHLVVDVSCLERKTDLRLMLCTKRVLIDISDDEMKCIKSIISSAIIDPEVKGGLRWPLGKKSSGDRYTVVGFGISSSGEVSREIIINMPKIVSEMEGQTIDEERLGEMLENNLKPIWDSCLSYEADAAFE